MTREELTQMLAYTVKSGSGLDVLAAIEAAGFRIVPVKATRAMLIAFSRELERPLGYAAMLAASPLAPTSPEDA